MTPTMTGVKNSCQRKGWSHEGKQRYNQYYDLISDRRETGGVKDMEKEVLEGWKNDEEDVRRDRDGMEETQAKRPKFNPHSGFNASKV